MCPGYYIAARKPRKRNETNDVPAATVFAMRVGPEVVKSNRQAWSRRSKRKNATTKYGRHSSGRRWPLRPRMENCFDDGARDNRPNRADDLWRGGPAGRFLAPGSGFAFETSRRPSDCDQPGRDGVDATTSRGFEHCNVRLTRVYFGWRRAGDEKKFQSSAKWGPPMGARHRIGQCTVHENYTLLHFTLSVRYYCDRWCARRIRAPTVLRDHHYSSSAGQYDGRKHSFISNIRLYNNILVTRLVIIFLIKSLLLPSAAYTRGGALGVRPSRILFLFTRLITVVMKRVVTRTTRAT